MSIEDIILDGDRRGVSALRPHLSPDFCSEAGGFVLGHEGTVAIVAGFFILSGMAPETDGPVGAVAMGDALQSLGYRVLYITDTHSMSIMEAITEPGAEIVDFPITDDDSSKRFADELMDEYGPSVLIAIERCGLSEGSLYRNMRDQDITQYTARVDHLFLNHPGTVGIGDGGNEIGMGLMAPLIPEVPTLVKFPCTTQTTKLVICSVGNWGGYGLVAAMSEQTGKNLLPEVDVDRERIKRAVDAGAIDGVVGKQQYSVDTFTLEENEQTLSRLHQYLTDQGASG